MLGNWKMNGSLDANAARLEALRAGLSDNSLAALSGPQAPVVAGVAPPAPYLAQVQHALQGSALCWGGQDASEHAAGAHTGDLAAAMLADFDCHFVLVGHSERRANHAETSHQVARKASAALQAGLMPVVCFGETLEQRESGQMLQVIESQLAPVLDLGAQSLARMVLAYEPVWAIGTGKTATPEQAQEVHAAVRQQLTAAGAPDVAVLYGGSVKAGNAASLFAMPDIDGGLIGGAALDPTEFLGIMRAACEAAAS